MKNNNFLVSLNEEGKLELVESSKEISDSYLVKSNNCLSSARILLLNDLYENSVTMSYYAMYNALLSLLFKTGIKCENHSAAILLLKFVYEKADLYEIISKAKKERIDKQYYVTDEKDNVTKQISQKMFEKAEEFIVKIKTEIQKLSNNDIEQLRIRFNELIR